MVILMNALPLQYKYECCRWVGRLALIWLFLIAASVGNILYAGDTPMRTVEEFKRLVDRNDLVGLCRLMAETDGSGPLKTSSYEQVQLSFGNLVQMWGGNSFSYVSERFGSGNPQRATVITRVSRHGQEVKFTLTKIESDWFIVDIEIFFK